MEVKELRIEIRKHHVTPGVNVLDLVIDADGEKIKVQKSYCGRVVVSNVCVIY